MTPPKTWMLKGVLSLLLVGCLDVPSTPNPSSPDAAAAVASIPATLVGAGDIAGCTSPYWDEATAKLISAIGGTVFTVGDNAYPSGTSDDFTNCYNPSWGQFKSRTRPAPGNHEYQTANAAGYFGYFGTLAGPCCRGYYTYTLGKWRIYSLNSEQNLSAQLTWLTNHLRNRPAQCVLAYWHRPLYSAGNHGSDTQMYAAFKALYQAGAEVVLTGHDHNYQRFAPMDADGQKRSAGVRQFVVGTGGAPPLDFPNTAPNLEARFKVRGVLQLTLSEASYEWKFLALSGRTLDSGNGTCH